MKFEYIISLAIGIYVGFSFIAFLQWLRKSKRVNELEIECSRYASREQSMENEISSLSTNSSCAVGGNEHNFVDKFDEEPVLLVHLPHLDLTAVPADECVTDVMEQFGTLVQECTEKKKTYVQSMCTRCGKVVNRNQTGVSLRKDS